MTTATAADEGSLFDRLFDEFLTRVRNRESPDPEEYARKYPELAKPIRDVFPTLHLLEAVGSVPAAPAPGEVARQLGEYRILREIARGGMGVVYEAVQESLGRHVALKVLGPTARTVEWRTRFEREARAAARLHHSNIVPVFAVGEQDGTLYYAMQYIRGQTLAAVLGELRDPDLVVASPTTVTLLTSMAETDFTVGDPVPPSHLSARTAGRRLYFLNVARLGVQVAEALDYAHREGIVHRDVKPANILLDAQGTPWVTDFGLAKVTADEGLTQTGAILGTLAYMAPEQFAGDATPLSDVYSLGVTLYELVTLRPAFRDENKLRLLERIRYETPPTPRSIDPSIPRDLETVILKAMAKEPARRYATSGELANDLRRFVDGRTVLARRAGWIRTGWRWCIRNRAVAALLAALLCSLTILAIGATAVALVSEREASEAKERAWRSKLDEAEAYAISDRLGQRFKSLNLLSEALAEARKRELTPNDELRFRSVAASALSRPDLEMERTWGEYIPRAYGWENELDFAPNLAEYAAVGPDKTVTIRGIPDNDERHRLPIEHPVAKVTYAPNGNALAVLDGISTKTNTLTVWMRNADGWEKRWSARSQLSVHFAFSADSQRLAFLDVADRSVRAVDWNKDQQWVQPLSAPIDSRWEISYAPDGRVVFPDPARNEKRLLSWWPGTPPVLLPVIVPSSDPKIVWDAEGRTMAIASANRTASNYDGQTGRPLSPLLLHPSNGIVPRPLGANGRLLSCDWTNRFRLWDGPAGRQLFSFPSLGSIARFDAEGERLATLSDQPDGRLRLFRFADGRELVRVVHRDGKMQTGGVGYSGCYFSPIDGICLVGVNPPNNKSVNAGFLVLEPRSGRVLAASTDAMDQPLGFLADGSFVTANPKGVRHWPRTATASVIRFGPPTTTIPDVKFNTTLLSASSDRRIVATVVREATGDVQVASIGSGRLRTIRTPFRASDVAVSPDGLWLMVGKQNRKQLAPNVRVYDPSNGQFVTELTVEGQTRVGFSPDGRWAWAAGFGGNARLWRTGTWSPGPTVGGRSVAFTADGSIAAVDDGVGAIRLLDPETGQTIVRIQVPENDDLWPLAFDPSGRHLALLSPDSWMLLLIDLGRIRHGLTEYGLDWSAPVLEPPTVPGAVEIDPGLVENRRLASLRLMEGRHLEALRYLEWVLRDAPQDGAALVDLSRLRLIAPSQTFDLAEGHKLLERLDRWIANHPDPTSTQHKQIQHTAQLLSAAADYRAGHYEVARDRFEAMTAERTGVTSAHRLFLAMSHWKLNEPDKAKRLLAEDERLVKIAFLNPKMAMSLSTWTSTYDALREEAIALIR
jgi:serine/threonine protein kinase/WD40 repeat protein